MIQTTKLLVRVSTPNGEPAANASVSARLEAAGVSDAAGYIDRSYLTATANKDGIAELVIWPNTAGLTDAAYHIVARGSDGGKLIDGIISVPESAGTVWLHDIVMTEPPTAKPYDEESIQLIQQARIDSSNYASQAVQARDSSQSYAIEVAANIAAAQDLRIGINAKAIEASDSANAARLYSQDAHDSREAVASMTNSVHEIAHEAELSASSAAHAAQSTIGLFSGAQAVADAVASALQSAEDSELSRSESEAARQLSQSSATASAEAAGLASDRAESARLSANAALEAKAATQADRLVVAQERSAVDASAKKVAEDKLAASQSASKAAASATTSLNRSAALIDHAETMRVQIDNSKTAAQDARDSAEALFGDLAQIDEAVQISYANRAIVNIALSNNLIILNTR